MDAAEAVWRIENQVVTWPLTNQAPMGPLFVLELFSPLILGALGSVAWDVPPHTNSP